MDMRVFTIFFYPFLFSSEQESQDADGYPPKKWQEMGDIYDTDEYLAITESLTWARKNPEFDYGSIMKGIKASNETLHKHLIKVADSYDNYIAQFGG